MKFLKSVGLRSEAHEVETKQGYILRVHRILAKNQGGYAPILIQPGMPVGSSAFYASRNKSLAFYLATSGCDVWIANPRGNRYSAKHKKMKLNDPRFWDFSFHEMGIYDLPAMIDYILKVTRHKKLIFVSHSEGGSSIAALLSTKPKYNDKILQNHLITPSVYMENFPHQLAKQLLNPMVDGFFKVQKTYDQLYNNFLIKNVYNIFIGTLPTCAQQQLMPVCTLAFEWFCGERQPKSSHNVDWKNFFETFTRIAITDTMSMKKILHYSQLMESGKFRQFDHHENNLNVYGTSEPPDYDLSLISSPTYIYGGDRDGFVSPKDLERLKNEIQNVKMFKILPTYSHCDVLIGERAKNDLYKLIMTAVKTSRKK